MKPELTHILSILILLLARKTPDWSHPISRDERSENLWQAYKDNWNTTHDNHILITRNAYKIYTQSNFVKALAILLD